MLYGAVCYYNMKAATDNVWVSGVVSLAGTADLGKQTEAQICSAAVICQPLSSKRRSFTGWNEQSRCSHSDFNQ